MWLRISAQLSACLRISARLSACLRISARLGSLPVWEYRLGSLPVWGYQLSSLPVWEYQLGRLSIWFLQIKISLVKSFDIGQMIRKTILRSQTNEKQSATVSCVASAKYLLQTFRARYHSLFANITIFCSGIFLNNPIQKICRFPFLLRYSKKIRNSYYNT